MGFRTKETKNCIPIKQQPYELVKHSSGKIGMILSVRGVSKNIGTLQKVADIELKVAIFDNDTSTKYGGWFLSDCERFEGEIILSNG